MASSVNFQKDVETLLKMGVKGVDKRTSSYNTSDFPGGLILSADAQKSHIAPSFITVSDVDSLKDICGIHNSLFTAGKLEDTHRIPPVRHAASQVITNPQDPHVCDALFAYVFGNSSTVESWKDTINTLRFPMKVTVFAASSIVVQPPIPLFLLGTDANPISLVCDSLTIEAGGQVITEGPGKVSADVMRGSDVSALLTDNPAPNLLSVGGNGGSGGNGGAGSTGGAGSAGANASESGKSGCNEAGTGGVGSIGGNGTAGGTGGLGGNANDINYSVTTLNGSYVVGSIGGSGGNGGPGGNGGSGGAGGPGGTGCRSCGTGSTGDGGKGGNGGNGGAGGNGGNGSKVYINYTSGSPVITVSNQPANGGNGGNAGNAGAGGTGATAGGTGNAGSSGNGGNGGQPGQVIVNGATSVHK
ncbi:hypothetical protein [Mucilaginibacter sp. SP1R1]|uniref:hypothetical protein n=1 Tax=Mucilaginibacter sp. SP1R1 TaxID=2723091 RepID=UPI00160A1F57|nr:hypothetical protein [Mucilaginibacter sp. SP1R1]MBB6148792.1 hypothetical protein [Mucilaginibacter sp. SP1R1]